jgi:hypothetical protein
MILGAYTEELNLHSFEKETTCKITQENDHSGRVSSQNRL